MDCDDLSGFTRTEDLLGLSTYLEFEESELTDPEFEFNGCLGLDKVMYSLPK